VEFIKFISRESVGNAGILGILYEVRLGNRVGGILIKCSVLRAREGVNIINIEQLDISVFL